jgi:phosphate acetyltransferase
VQDLSPFWTSLKPPDGGALPRIAFTDSTDPRVRQAIQQITKDKLAHPYLIGASDQTDPTHTLVPKDNNEKKHLAQILLDKSKRQKPSLEEMESQLSDPLNMAIAYLFDGKIDGIIAGSLRPTAEIIQAALKFIGPAKGYRLVSGLFLLETDFRKTANNTPFLFADCAVSPDPSPRALATIALGAARAYRYFTTQAPRVAFLSFSTRRSADHPLIERIQEAVRITRKLGPDLVVDGEIQVDAALDTDVAKIKKAADSPLQGGANIFIFPNLEAGNIGYKLIQRFVRSRIAGPLLWGLGKPMSDLSRGCTVQEIIDTTLCIAKMSGENINGD